MLSLAKQHCGDIERACAEEQRGLIDCSAVDCFAWGMGQAHVMLFFTSYNLFYHRPATWQTPPNAIHLNAYKTEQKQQDSNIVQRYTSQMPTKQNKNNNMTQNERKHDSRIASIFRVSNISLLFSKNKHIRYL